MLELNYRFKNLLPYFPNLFDALEVYFTLHGLKPVCRLIFSEDRLKLLNNICNKFELFYEIGNFKIIKKNCIIDNDVDVTSSYYVYFSKEETKATMARIAEEDFDDDKVGKLFGYPKCCRDFYKENNKESRQFRKHYAPMSHRNSAHFNYLTNNLLSKFGYSLVSHFPCKHNCLETVKYAKKANEILNKENPAIAFEIRQKIRGPVFFHIKTGIQAFDSSFLKDGRWYYKKPLFVKACDVYNTFLSGNNLMVCKKVVKIFKDDRLLKEFNQDELLTFVFE